MESDSDVARVFDRIAPGWYGFRHRSIFQKELEEVAERWGSGSLLNIGCGHGPDFVPFRGKFHLYGIDISVRMLELARKYARKFSFEVELAAADARCLPFADRSFDYAIAVASLHHIKGHEEQLAAMHELRRVLRWGGEAFITVWNRWQPRFWFQGNDVLVPWRTGNEVLYRYYHLFSCRELAALARQAGLEVLHTSPEPSYRFPVKLFSRNICLLVRNGR